MSQGFYDGLSSVITSSWVNDMSVYMVAANKVHHGQYAGTSGW